MRRTTRSAFHRDAIRARPGYREHRLSTTALSQLASSQRSAFGNQTRHTRSNTPAAPMPVPMHMLIMP